MMDNIAAIENNDDTRTLEVLKEVHPAVFKELYMWMDFLNMAAHSENLQSLSEKISRRVADLLFINKPVEPMDHETLDDLCSNDLFKFFFNHTSDMAVFLDTQGRIVEINNAGVALSGFFKEELVGKQFWTIPKVFKKEDIPTYLKIFAKALQGKPTIDFLGRICDASGTEGLMIFSVYPIMDGKNEVKKVFVVAVNIY